MSVNPINMVPEDSGTGAGGMPGGMIVGGPDDPGMNAAQGGQTPSMSDPGSDAPTAPEASSGPEQSAPSDPGPSGGDGGAAPDPAGGC
jgi:hypothetical protein